MKVIVKGELSVEQLAKKLIEVAEHTANKVEQDSEDKVSINAWKVHEAEVMFKFDVEGIDEPQIMTVEHHAGQSEALTWIIDTDTDTTATNEHESFIDTWTASQVKGEPLVFEEIESEYDDEGLVLEDTEQYADMSKEVYDFIGSDDKLVRVYQEDKLVQEYKLIYTGDSFEQVEV